MVLPEMELKYEDRAGFSSHDNERDVLYATVQPFVGCHGHSTRTRMMLSLRAHGSIRDLTSRIEANFCYLLNLGFLRTGLANFMKRPGYNEIMFSDSGYSGWRDEELTNQFFENFQLQDVQAKCILDFGCGKGELSFLVASAGASSVIGIDLNEELITAAQTRLANTTGVPRNVEFLWTNDPTTIPLPSDSVDVILCFDVLEHVMHVQPIFNEWYRVLRREGQVLIWWVPWLHPGGHHIESLVPIPWAHVFFSEPALTRTAAKVYDSPTFKPRIWDIDPQTGMKKPNKWKTFQELPEVNRLTIAQFERLASTSNFHVRQFLLTGFRGSAISRLTNPLLKSKRLREYFCANLSCRLRRL
jgi:ubiquinone/menaquinone biosynthesis C-methylase UbiE